MSVAENNTKLIRETQATIDFVRDNWVDPLGYQYIYWLEQTLERIRQLELRREIIHLKIEKISLYCNNVLSTDDEAPKVLKKTR